MTVDLSGFTEVVLIDPATGHAYAAGSGGGGSVTYDSGFSAVLDGDGADIATGLKGDFEVPFNCTLGHLTGLFDAAGTFTMDILKSTGAAYPTFTSVSGGAVAMGGAVKYSDSDLTGWTLAFNQGDVLRFNLTACTGIERASVNLRVRKTS